MVDSTAGADRRQRDAALLGFTRDESPAGARVLARRSPPRHSDLGSTAAAL